MNIPVINPNAATVGVIFPPMLIPEKSLTQIYTTILGQHKGYTSFNLLAQGGARISRGDGSYVHIEPDKVQVHDIIQDISFIHAKERIAGIYKTAFSLIVPQAIIVTGVKLIALVDTNEPDGSTKFLNGALGAPLAKEKLEYFLGAKQTGVGLRLSSHKELPWPSVYELRIEPFFRDLSKLYVELDVQFPGPSQKIGPIEAQIDHVSGYLKKEVKDFLSAL